MKKYEGHTQGTWRKAEVRHGYDCIIRSKTNDPICATVYAGYNKTEAEANIRLIADAPMLAEQNAKMLDMLKRLQAIFHHETDSVTAFDSGDVDNILSEIEAN